MPQNSDRRSFLKQTTTAAGAAALSNSIAKTAIASSAHPGGSDEIRVVLIGCGARGKGAMSNLFRSKGNVKLVAVHDAFAENAELALKILNKKSYAEKIDVSPEHVFSGLEGYKAAIDVECDLVVIATPPGFKPQQFEYAVRKGRHVFMEKPVATDPAGVRRVLKSVEESKKKRLLVGVGLQRRHEPQYKETIERIHDGAIGDVISQQVYWNGPGIWYRNRKDSQNEMQFQCNNWYHFNWLSGDQINEQHIHNLDVGCWVKNMYPVECNGMGGRAQRLNGDPTKSQIFDHTFCEYTFTDGSKMFSQGRHQKGTWTFVGEHAQGTKGTADPSGVIKGENSWEFAGRRVGGHQQEQNDLVATLMNGDIYNEGEYGAYSTFTAILGREACYSGKVIKWDELLEKGGDLAPGIDSFTFDSPVPESARPGKDGAYPVPVPGKYNPFA